MAHVPLRTRKFLLSHSMCTRARTRRPWLTIMYASINTKSYLVAAAVVARFVSADIVCMRSISPPPVGGERCKCTEIGCMVCERMQRFHALFSERHTIATRCWQLWIIERNVKYEIHRHRSSVSRVPSQEYFMRISMHTFVPQIPNVITFRFQSQSLASHLHSPSGKSCTRLSFAISLNCSDFQKT